MDASSLILACLLVFAVCMLLCGRPGRDESRDFGGCHVNPPPKTPRPDIRPPAQRLTREDKQ